MYIPSELVEVLVVTPVAELVTVTAASTTAAALGSVTVPVITPRSLCAHSESVLEKSTRPNKIAKHRGSVELIIPCSEEVLFSILTESSPENAERSEMISRFLSTITPKNRDVLFSRESPMCEFAVFFR